MNTDEAKKELDELIASIEDEDAPDHLQYCWVILKELKQIRRLMG
mgnify:CR=1 FL=1